MLKVTMLLANTTKGGLKEEVVWLKKEKRA